MYVPPFKIITMETKRTNRPLLFKGLQNLAISLLLMFIGPTLIYVAFSNQDKATYPIVLGLSILICIAAVFFFYRGIKIIMQSLFDN